MKIKGRATSYVLGAAMLAAGFVSPVLAAPWNKLTNMKINERIEIPGGVLEPGDYVIRLVDHDGNRQIVQFLNDRQDEVHATVISVPNRRLEPSGDTVMSFYETSEGQPPALRAWFYPGDTFGHEFAYPRERADELSRHSKMNVPAIDDETMAQLNQERDAQATPEKVGSIRVTRLYIWSPEGQEIDPETAYERNRQADAQRQGVKARDYGRFEAHEDRTQAGAGQQTQEGRAGQPMTDAERRQHEARHGEHAGHAGQTTGAQHGQQPQTGAHAAHGQQQEGEPSTPEKGFLENSARTNLAEIRLGQLALERAASGDVREFAQSMINDHSEAQKKLEQIAAQLNIQVPSEPTAEQKATYDRLAQLRGEQFDREYIKTMVQEHEKSVKFFRHSGMHASTDQVEEFAKETLPKLEEHLQRAERKAADLGVRVDDDRQTGGSVSQPEHQAPRR